MTVEQIMEVQVSHNGPSGLRPSFPEQIVARYEQIEVSTHPLFVRLSGRPVDLQTIWLLMANLRVAISAEFVTWLATTIARIDDRRIASLLAKQLNDELGNGNNAEIHSILLDRFVEGLDPWRPTTILPETLEPGRTLLTTMSEIFGAAPYVAIGALVASEIFAKKMDHCLGDVVRRQNSISEEALLWLTIHEVLEVDHADDSLELAKLVPPEEACMKDVLHGAASEWSALWRFLSDIDRVSQASH
jgi:pyrroloquinoline quinone (PQQ) biosynthesis protein C